MWLIGALICAGMLTGSESSAILLNYSSQDNAELSFLGNGVGATFDFSSGDGGWDFSITNSDTILHDAENLFGNISGPFTFGAITTSGTLQTASVSGMGALSIFDGTTTLTADLTWVEIRTQGIGGALNIFGDLNLTNIMYTGSNSDLLELKNTAAGNGSTSLNFQLGSVPDLSALAANGVTTDLGSYSGQISVIPEPATAGLFIIGLIGFATHSRRNRRFV